MCCDALPASSRGSSHLNLMIWRVVTMWPNLKSWIPKKAGNWTRRFGPRNGETSLVDFFWRRKFWLQNWSACATGFWKDCGACCAADAIPGRCQQLAARTEHGRGPHRFLASRPHSAGMISRKERRGDLASVEIWSLGYEQFGDLPGVTIHNTAAMTQAEIEAVVNGPGIVIGVTCPHFPHANITT
jgi:hypothetical protein